MNAAHHNTPYAHLALFTSDKHHIEFVIGFLPLFHLSANPLNIPFLACVSYNKLKEGQKILIKY